MQAVCNAKYHYTAVQIQNPALASNFISFLTSILFQLLKIIILVPGLALFGDNAYVTIKFMVTPYKYVTSTVHDGFNYFQSQLRIVIEQAFGMLIHRQGVLCWPLSNKMGIKRQIQLVICLCNLHNFIIDATETENGDISIPHLSPHDTLYSSSHG